MNDNGCKGGCTGDAAIKQAVDLFSNMLRHTHAPVHYFQNDILSIVNFLHDSKSHFCPATKHAIAEQFQKAIPPISSSIPDLTFPTISDATLEELKTWNFDAFVYDEMELLSMTKHMFEFFHLLEEFQIKAQTLELFLLNVKAHYFDNPYHNFRHAFDVIQTGFCFLVEKNVKRYFKPVDILVFFISCICHDIEHGSLNNSYLANTGSELSLLHNDISILENHHCYITFKILQRPELNILQAIEPKLQRAIRKRVIDCILHTDMGVHSTYHMPILAQLVLENLSFDVEDEKYRVLLVDLMVHMCDLANIARPFPLSKNWCDRVTVEFFNQGALEKTLGFSVKPNMDCSSTTVAQNMVNFIDALAEYIRIIGQVIPEIAEYYEMAFQNRAEWEKLIQLQKEGKEPP